jgi:hypothetical protein
MATTATAPGAAHGRSRAAAVALLGISVIALLYLAFLYQVYNDPGVRDLGFTGQTEIWRYSGLVFALLFSLMMVVWMRWVPPGAVAAAPAAAGAPARTGGAPASIRASASPDPASRPGAPPSTRFPLITPEALQGGWKRYKFPAERTGGLYVDTDIVVDDAPPSAAATSTRGRSILRVRDEVARVCVRCDLIDHCHSKVAALITREDMQGNHECVPGLKRIAQARIEQMKRDQLQRDAAAAAPPAPEAALPDALATAEPAPQGADSEAAVEPRSGGESPAPDPSNPPAESN